MKSIYVVLDLKKIQKDYQYLLDKKLNFIKKPIKREWGTSTIFPDNCGNLTQICQDLK